MKVSLGKLGDARIVRSLHHGAWFDVALADLGGRPVCLKHPAPLGAAQCLSGLFSAHWDFLFSRLISMIADTGFHADWCPADDLLRGEAERLRATEGVWNHEVLTFVEESDVGPCLVTPFHEGTPFAGLDRPTRRRLFPRMLPSLWRALAHTFHGDLNGGNLIVQGESRFVLIDPCVGAFGPRTGGDSYWTASLTFTTTPALYPLLAPHCASPIPLRAGASLSEHFEASLYALASCSPPVPVGRHTLMVGGDGGPPVLGRKPSPDEPHPADLLAAGVLHFEALTGRRPFFSEEFREAAWLGGRVSDAGALGDFAAARRALLNEPARPSAIDASVTPAEDALAHALLTLQVPDLPHLLQLVTPAAFAAEAAR
jgi:hypothetical protein